MDFDFNDFVFFEDLLKKTTLSSLIKKIITEDISVFAFVDKICCFSSFEEAENYFKKDNSISFKPYQFTVHGHSTCFNLEYNSYKEIHTDTLLSIMNKGLDKIGVNESEGKVIGSRNFFKSTSKEHPYQYPDALIAVSSLQIFSDEIKLHNPIFLNKTKKRQPKIKQKIASKKDVTELRIINNDFTKLEYKGNLIHFKPRQAAIIKHLHENRRRFKSQEILDDLKITSERKIHMSEIFRNHSAIKLKLIILDGCGNIELNTFQ